MELKAWQKAAILLVGVIVLGAMIYFGIDAADSVGLND